MAGDNGDYQIGGLHKTARVIIVLMKKVIVANWKLNPSTLKEARLLFSKTKNTLSVAQNVRAIVCPPHVFVQSLVVDQSSFCMIGSQDVFYEGAGAFTGEVSPASLKNMKVKYSLVGHSERREMGDSDLTINKKIVASLAAGLCPILCIGEKNRDDSGSYFIFLRNQLVTALAGVSRKLAGKIMVAYEPIWAIGKGATRSDSPEDVMEISIYIKKVLTDIYGREVGTKIPILYGGSVDEKNASDLIEKGGADGLLVGRASLDIDEFSTLLNFLNEKK